ncbi:MAG TPA: RluA family pseudouridine synthase [Spirochaetia bacterium]|nr:RluA family pseudouridine synthase [Spirochaetia bacterium]HRZ64606.1 RluA family pseudouridine synthase [Spirochaetia bacterium]
MESYAILYEDDEILIANKLAPIPVQPEKSGDASLQELLKRELAARAAGPGGAGPAEGKESALGDGDSAAAGPFLEAAHRIDRRASGAVAFAKTSKALSTIEAAFRDHRVAKEYLACVEREPVPPEGKLEHRLVWDKRRNVVRAAPLEAGEAELSRRDAEARGGSKARLRATPDKAVLEYRLAGRSERYFFVSARLVTGRHHQIRAQFSAAGFPIRGDLKYGARRSAPNGLIMLHARRLVIPQPRTGETIEVVAPFPPSEPLWAAYSEKAPE